MRIDLISSCEKQSGYVYYQVTRGVDSVRSHMYSNSLEVETFVYVLPFSFKSKSLKVMICEDIRWGRCDIKSTSLLGNVMNMNSISAESGSGTEDIITKYEGEEIEVGFNSKYILEMVNQLTDEEISLEFNDSSSPVIAIESSSPDLIYVLMPMRV